MVLREPISFPQFIYGQMITWQALFQGDRRGRAMKLFGQVSRFDQSRLRTIWTDAAYRRDELHELAAARRWPFEIGSRPPG